MEEEVKKDRRRQGARIKELREGQHVSQTKLALMAGIERGHLSKIEGGRHAPKTDTISRIVHALGITLHDFYNW